MMPASIRSFFIALLLMLPGIRASATHYRGGEISYRSTGSGFYEVSVTLYSDCLHGDEVAIQQDLPVFIGIFNRGNNSVMLRDSIPGTNQPMPVNAITGCFNDNRSYCGKYAVARHTYRLSPDSSGFSIVNMRCCMGMLLGNTQDPGTVGLTLRADMAGPDKLGSTGANSSPVFRSLPPLRLCINTSFTIDFGATDPDGDRLVYHFLPAFKGASANDAKPYPYPPFNAPVPYLPGYSFDHPLGKNGQLTLDTLTGMLNGSCSVPGEYLVSVACDEYRGGILIGTVTRSFVVDIEDCNKQTVALLQKDSVALKAGLDSVAIIRCAGGRTIQFSNQSKGATAYHWDFGVAGVDNDTSAEANPSFTYPGPGRYPLTLVAIGGNCADTLHTQVWLSDDDVKPDFAISGGNCNLDTVTLTDQSNIGSATISRYMWQMNGNTAEGNPAQVIITEVGKQLVREIVWTQAGCVALTEKSIEAHNGSISTSGDTTVVQGAELFLHAYGGSSYNWIAVPPADFVNFSPGDAQQQVNTAMTGRDFTFIVMARDAQGCGAVDTIHVNVAQYGYVFVPSAFSPNGDGRNDLLKAQIAGYNFLSFSVYNRLGNRVYESSNIHAGWDGRYKDQEAAMDTYYWMLRVKSTTSGADLVFSGDVFLMR